MTDAHINKTMQYVQSLSPDLPRWTKDFVQYAEQYRIPIIDEVSLNYLLQLIRVHQPKCILEIGTAIGYSAIHMHKVVPSARIVTIEKDKHIAQVASDNIKTYAQNNSIRIIQGDALIQLELLQKEETTFDFVFIDAAKSQYDKYFKAIDSLVAPGGVVVTDNVLFRGYVTGENKKVPKRFKSLVTKIQSFNENTMIHEQYHSSIIPLGDGLLVSVKIQ